MAIKVQVIYVNNFPFIRHALIAMQRIQHGPV